MYLSDQNATMGKLIEKIATLKTQIASTYNSKIETDLIISDEPIGSAKLVLMILAAFAALLFAFFGVFVTNFIANFNKTRE